MSLLYYIEKNIKDGRLSGMSNFELLYNIKEEIGHAVAIVKFDIDQKTRVCIIKAWDMNKNLIKTQVDSKEYKDDSSYSSIPDIETLINREKKIYDSIHHPSFTHRYLGPFDIQIVDEKLNPFPCKIILLDYIPGCSLKDYIYTNQDKYLLCMDTTQIIIILYGIARAIAYLHKKGFNHRDLKPGNILLNCSLQPLICDFETAKQPNNNCTNTGTPGYVPKEVENPVKGYNESKRDVYAFGIILFELIFRHDPDKIDTDNGTVRSLPNRCNNDPWFKRVFNSAGPLQTIYQNCTKDDWMTRPTFADIASDIKKFAFHESLENNLDYRRFCDYDNFLNEYEDEQNARRFDDPYSLMSFDEQLINSVRLQMCTAMWIFAKLYPDMRHVIEPILILNEINPKFFEFRQEKRHQIDFVD